MAWTSSNKNLARTRQELWQNLARTGICGIELDLNRAKNETKAGLTCDKTIELNPGLKFGQMRPQMTRQKHKG